MLIWFKSLKRQTQIFIIIGSLIFVTITFLSIKSAYWKYKYYKSQTKELNEKIKELRKDFKDIDSKRKANEHIIDYKNTQIDSLKKLIKTTNNDAIKKPDAVRAYPDRKLDSILTNHRHITPAKNRNR